MSLTGCVPRKRRELNLGRLLFRPLSAHLNSCSQHRITMEGWIILNKSSYVGVSHTVTLSVPERTDPLAHGPHVTCTVILLSSCSVGKNVHRSKPFKSREGSAATLKSPEASRDHGFSTPGALEGFGSWCQHHGDRGSSYSESPLCLSLHHSSLAPKHGSPV